MIHSFQSWKGMQQTFQRLRRTEQGLGMHGQTLKPAWILARRQKGAYGTAAGRFIWVWNEFWYFIFLACVRGASILVSYEK
jgi:hypothetical protein